MPTYGYRCPENHTFERFQKITDPPVAECEVCGKPVKKILYPVGIAFKGSGFYVNDYAPSGETAKRKSDSEPAPASPSAATDTKTEAKPEAKSEKAESVPAAPAPATSTAPAKSE